MESSSSNGDNSSNDSSSDEQELVEATSAGLPLLDLLALMRKEKFETSVPDAVAERMLQISGCVTSDPKVTKLISLAAQTFVSAVANDALQHYKMRGAPPQQQSFNKFKGKDEPRNTLTMADLVSSLEQQGIVTRKPPYFV